MSVGVHVTGRDAIHLLRDVFNITHQGIRKIEITAEVNDLCIMNIESIVKINNNEIEINSVENNKYEITVKKIENI